MISLLKLLIFFIKSSCINNNPSIFCAIFVQNIEGLLFEIDECEKYKKRTPRVPFIWTTHRNPPLFFYNVSNATVSA